MQFTYGNKKHMRNVIGLLFARHGIENTVRYIGPFIKMPIYVRIKHFNFAIKLFKKIEMID